MKEADEDGVSHNVAIHRLEYIGASGSRRHIQLLIQRKEFESIVMRNAWPRTGSPIAKVSTVPGLAIRLPSAVWQLSACGGHVLGELRSGPWDVPHQPVEDVIDAFTGTRLQVMKNQGEAGRVFRHITPLERRRDISGLR